MITLFRRMREKLIQSGSISKYLLYAMGEVFLVVIGIIIALQVNNWSQQRYEYDLESKYLKELLEDFKENKQTSDRVIQIIDDTIPRLIALLEQSALDKPNVTVDSLNALFTYINIMPTFISTDRAYLNITGNGELKILRNDQVKYAMALYYSQLDMVKLVQNTHELELVESFQPYIIDHLDFQAVNVQRVDDYTLPPPVNEEAILDVLPTQKFRNIITTKWTILTDLLNQFREIDEDIDEVVKVLEQEIRIKN